MLAFTLDPVEKLMKWYKNGKLVLELQKHTIPDGKYRLGVATCFEKDRVRIENSHEGCFNEIEYKKLCSVEFEKRIFLKRGSTKPFWKIL